MRETLLILHASPQAADRQAYTALRLARALLPDNKEVQLFLVEDGAELIDPQLSADNPCSRPFYELLDVGLAVQVCGASLRKMGGNGGYLLPGTQRGSMIVLSALMREADGIPTC